MAAISHTIFSDAFFWIHNFVFKISLKFVPKGQTDKPLFEPMLTQFIYAEGGGGEMSLHDVQLVVIL